MTTATQRIVDAAPTVNPHGVAALVDALLCDLRAADPAAYAQIATAPWPPVPAWVIDDGPGCAWYMTPAAWRLVVNLADAVESAGGVAPLVRVLDDGGRIRLCGPLALVAHGAGLGGLRYRDPVADTDRPATLDDARRFVRRWPVWMYLVATPPVDLLLAQLDGILESAGMGGPVPAWVARNPSPVVVPMWIDAVNTRAGALERRPPGSDDAADLADVAWILDVITAATVPQRVRP